MGYVRRAFVFLHIIAMLCGLAALAGCDGHSGTSGSLPGGDDVGSAATTVRAKVSLSYGSAKAPVGPMAVDPIEEAYQSAVVTLTLPDGRKFTMSYDGDGQYSCVVSNLENGSAGYIEAQINDMVLKAFFDGLFARQSVIDAGEVGADSTFAADVLTSFAETLSGSDLDIADILSGVTDASLDIDIASLNAQVNDGQSVEYELARRSYGSVLTWNNINLDSGEIDGLISNSPAVESLFTSIETGVYVPPSQGGPAEEAKIFAAQFLNTYFNTRTTESLATYLATDNFLWSGLDQAGFSGQALSAWNTDPLFTNLMSADFTNTLYSVTEVSDFTSLGRTMYLISLQGTFDVTTLGGVTMTRSWDGILKKFHAAKVTTGSGDLWVIFGDRKKSTFDYRIGYFNSAELGRFAEIDASVVYGDLTPTTMSATVASASPQPVYADSGDAQRFFLKLHGGPTSPWEYSTQGYTVDTGLAFTQIDSELLTITATFPDTSTETFQKVISIQSPTTTVTRFTQNANGSLDIEWRPPTVTERLLRVDVKMPRHGLTYSLAPSARALNIPAAELSAAGVAVGVPDNLDVVYVTQSAEYGFRVYFSWNGIP